MKTSRFEIACERERTEDNESHAIGFVSNIMVRRDAGVPPAYTQISTRYQGRG
jgi:hypothetical protein